MMSKLFFLLAFLSFLNFAKAANNDDLMRIALTTPLTGIDVARNDSSPQFSFLPNSQILIETNYSRDWWSIGYSIKGKNEDSGKGKTSYKHFRLGYHYHKFHLDLLYSKFKGFYLEAPQREPGVQFTFPELTAETHSAVLTYFFSKDFLRGNETLDFHQFIKTEPNNHHSSSWFTSLIYQNFKMKNFPVEDGELSTLDNSELLKLAEGKFDTWSLLFGIDYIYIHRRFFTDIKFGLGPGFQSQSYKFLSEDINENKWNTNFHLDINFGFYALKSVFGFKVESLTIQNSLKDSIRIHSKSMGASFFMSKLF